MSKVNIEFDTVSKELSVSIDGQEVANVYELMIYRYCCDEASIDIYTSKKDKYSDVREMTRISASKNTDGATPSKYPGFFETPENSKVIRDIAQFFDK
jgi:hypothetical protein